jgi:uncharacterized protein (DUF983 family)
VKIAVLCNSLTSLLKIVPIRLTITRVPCKIVFPGGVMSEIQTESQNKKCPNCGEEILKEAIKCRFCKTNLSEDKSEDGMSSGQATFFYSSIVAIFVGVLLISKSINLSFIMTIVFSFILYLMLDSKHKK